MVKAKIHATTTLHSCLLSLILCWLLPQPFDSEGLVALGSADVPFQQPQSKENISCTLQATGCRLGIVSYMMQQVILKTQIKCFFLTVLNKMKIIVRDISSQCSWTPGLHIKRYTGRMPGLSRVIGSMKL